LILGLFLALLTGLASWRHTGRSRTGRVLNPFRWVISVVYMIGPFFLEMAKANLEVAYCVITGRIRPGIVRVHSGMKDEMGVLLLANCVTLTPGTLTLEIDERSNDLYVHKINVAPGEEQRDTIEASELFTFNCMAWIRRIAE
jgi:multicomponent Na+:H+ antiporter subunit E